MSKVLKNTTSSDLTIAGQLIAAFGQYTIQVVEDKKFSEDDFLISKISSGEIVVNDGISDLSISSAVLYLQGSFPRQIEISDKDGDTDGIKVTTKYAPDGFYQRLHEIEFTTSTVGGAIHDKDMNNVDTGYSSCDFFEDVAGVETLMVSPTQTDLDTKCIRTDYKFMPDVDYMVKSGVVTHQEIIDIGVKGEIYMWGSMLDVDPSLNAFGLFPIEVLGGGMAMSFVNARTPVGLKGVNGTMLYHAAVTNPAGGDPIAMPPGLGTNRIKFVMRHNVGVKHRFQAIFEIFKA